MNNLKTYLESNEFSDAALPYFLADALTVKDEYPRYVEVSVPPPLRHSFAECLDYGIPESKELVLAFSRFSAAARASVNVIPSQLHDSEYMLRTRLGAGDNLTSKMLSAAVGVDITVPDHSFDAIRSRNILSGIRAVTSMLLRCDEKSVAVETWWRCIQRRDMSTNFAYHIPHEHGFKDALACVRGEFL